MNSLVINRARLNLDYEVAKLCSVDLFNLPYEINLVKQWLEYFDKKYQVNSTSELVTLFQKTGFHLTEEQLTKYLELIYKV